jgi:hypothetical protein
MIIEGIAICSVVYFICNSVCFVRNMDNLDSILTLQYDNMIYIDNDSNINRYAPLYTLPSGHDIECSICLERLNKIKRKTVCGHIYCAECIENWFNKHKRCPLCNKEFI